MGVCPIPEIQNGQVPSLAQVLAWSRFFFRTANQHTWDLVSAGADPSQRELLLADISQKSNPRVNCQRTKIAFADDPDGRYDLFTANPDGTGLQNITEDDDTDLNPSWSPDGTRIVFEKEIFGQNDLVLYDLEDGSQTLLFSSPVELEREPDWSPDGSQIAFIDDSVSGISQVWTIDPQGENLQNLNTHRESRHPVWSADGAWIAYEADADTDKFLELWIIPTDGQGQPVGYDPSGDPGPGHKPIDALLGSWSPLSLHVLFGEVQYREGELGRMVDTTRFRIYDLETGAVSDLSAPNAASLDFAPAWSLMGIPDLRIDLDAPPVLRPGEESWLILEVQNIGDGTAENVRVELDLPSEIVYIDAGIPPAMQNPLAWELSDLAEGESAPAVQVQVRAAPGAADGPVTLHVRLSSALPDPYPANNEDTATIQIVTQTRLFLPLCLR